MDGSQSILELWRREPDAVTKDIHMPSSERVDTKQIVSILKAERPIKTSSGMLNGTEAKMLETVDPIPGPTKLCVRSQAGNGVVKKPKSKTVQISNKFGNKDGRNRTLQPHKISEFNVKKSKALRRMSSSRWRMSNSLCRRSYPSTWSLNVGKEKKIKSPDIGCSLAEVANCKCLNRTPYDHKLQTPPPPRRLNYLGKNCDCNRPRSKSPQLRQENLHIRSKAEKPKRNRSMSPNGNAATKTRKALKHRRNSNNWRRKVTASGISMTNSEDAYGLGGQDDPGQYNDDNSGPCRIRIMQFLGQHGSNRSVPNSGFPEGNSKLELKCNKLQLICCNCEDSRSCLHSFDEWKGKGTKSASNANNSSGSESDKECNYSRRMRTQRAASPQQSQRYSRIEKISQPPTVRRCRVSIASNSSDYGDDEYFRRPCDDRYSDSDSRHSTFAACKNCGRNLEFEYRRHSKRHSSAQNEQTRKSHTDNGRCKPRNPRKSDRNKNADKDNCQCCECTLKPNRASGQDCGRPDVTQQNNKSLRRRSSRSAVTSQRSSRADDNTGTSRRTSRNSMSKNEIGYQNANVASTSKRSRNSGQDYDKLDVPKNKITESPRMSYRSSVTSGRISRIDDVDNRTHRKSSTQTEAGNVKKSPTVTQRHSRSPTTSRRSSRGDDNGGAGNKTLHKSISYNEIVDKNRNSIASTSKRNRQSGQDFDGLDTPQNKNTEYQRSSYRSSVTSGRSSRADDMNYRIPRKSNESSRRSARSTRRSSRADDNAKADYRIQRKSNTNNEAGNQNCKCCVCTSKRNRKDDQACEDPDAPQKKNTGCPQRGSRSGRRNSQKNKCDSASRKNGSQSRCQYYKDYDQDNSSNDTSSSYELQSGSSMKCCRCCCKPSNRSSSGMEGSMRAARSVPAKMRKPTSTLMKIDPLPRNPLAMDSPVCFCCLNRQKTSDQIGQPTWCWDSLHFLGRSNKTIVTGDENCAVNVPCGGWNKMDTDKNTNDKVFYSPSRLPIKHIRTRSGCTKKRKSSSPFLIGVKEKKCPGLVNFNERHALSKYVPLPKDQILLRMPCGRVQKLDPNSSSSDTNSSVTCVRNSQKQDGFYSFSGLNSYDKNILKDLINQKACPPLLPQNAQSVRQAEERSSSSSSSNNNLVECKCVGFTKKPPEEIKVPEKKVKPEPKKRREKSKDPKPEKQPKPKKSSSKNCLSICKRIKKPKSETPRNTKDKKPSKEKIKKIKTTKVGSKSLLSFCKRNKTPKPERIRMPKPKPKESEVKVNSKNLFSFCIRNKKPKSDEPKISEPPKITSFPNNSELENIPSCGSNAKKESLSDELIQSNEKEIQPQCDCFTPLNENERQESPMRSEYSDDQKNSVEYTYICTNEPICSECNDKDVKVLFDSSYKFAQCNGYDLDSDYENHYNDPSQGNCDKCSYSNNNSRPIYVCGRWNQMNKEQDRLKSSSSPSENNFYRMIMCKSYHQNELSSQSYSSSSSNCGCQCPRNK